MRKRLSKKALRRSSSAKLAEDNGTSQHVKDFGKRMVNDHSKADEQLKTAASTEKIALPQQMSAKDQAEYDRLLEDYPERPLTGLMHATWYAITRPTLPRSATKPTMARTRPSKSFATETLPTLQDHLKMAREMYNGVSATNQSTTGQKNHSGA